MNPVYGSAMTFSNNGQNTYVTQNNYLYHNRPCSSCQRDGKYSKSPPFYSLQPNHCNPIYYNYYLPNVFPYSKTECYPKPTQYWYYPYYRNDGFYETPLSVPKGGSQM